MSNLLVIDTSAGICTVILQTADSMAVRQRSGPRTHGQFLLPAIAELSREQHLELMDLEAIAVVAGPGSFTGLRIGIGVVQGLANALALPVVLLSSLEWLALEAAIHFTDCRMLVCRKAREDEYYVGRYRVQAPLQLQRIGEESVEKGSSIRVPVCDQDDEQLPWVAVGDGWSDPQLADLLKTSSLQTIDHDLQPGPDSLCRLARLRMTEGAQVPADQVLPFYLQEDLNYKTSI